MKIGKALNEADFVNQKNSHEMMLGLVLVMN